MIRTSARSGWVGCVSAVRRRDEIGCTDQESARVACRRQQIEHEEADVTGGVRAKDVEREVAPVGGRGNVSVHALGHDAPEGCDGAYGIQRSAVAKLEG